MPAAIGDTVRLTYRLHFGSPPTAGDGLRTPTGRSYIIRAVAGRHPNYRLTCTVVPKDVDLGPFGEWYSMIWNPRKKRARGA